jgi:predicted membrane channel-forming protein YqfA (hemolysin III family)
VFCVAFLLIASGSYHAAAHALGVHDPVTRLLLRIDLSTVWLILAGFFLLPHLIAQRGAWRWVPLVLVGSAACLGIASTLFDTVEKSAAEAVVPYALASLIGVASTIKFLTQRGPRNSALLLVFWVAFAAATACFVLEAPTVVDGWVGHHEVWHTGILVGIYAHWRFVLQLAEAPTPQLDSELGGLPADVRALGSRGR